MRFDDLDYRQAERLYNIIPYFDERALDFYFRWAVEGFDKIWEFDKVLSGWENKCLNRMF